MRTSKPKPTTLAQEVLAGRVVRFWTQTDLAEVAGVSASQIANIERGATKTCTPRVLARIGSAIGKDLTRFAK